VINSMRSTVVPNPAEPSSPMRIVFPRPSRNGPPVENSSPGTDLSLVDAASVTKEGDSAETSVLSSSSSSSDPCSLQKVNSFSASLT
jgi:hypothetical protein